MTKKNQRLILAYARRLLKVASHANKTVWKRGEREATIRECADWIVCITKPREI